MFNLCSYSRFLLPSLCPASTVANHCSGRFFLLLGLLLLPLPSVQLSPHQASLFTQARVPSPSSVCIIYFPGCIVHRRQCSADYQGTHPPALFHQAPAICCCCLLDLICFSCECVYVSSQWCQCRICSTARLSLSLFSAHNDALFVAMCKKGGRERKRLPWLGLEATSSKVKTTGERKKEGKRGHSSSNKQVSLQWWR